MTNKDSNTVSTFSLTGKNTYQQKGLKLKVCGMKYNTLEVANLQPDYLGFICYDKSSRFFDAEIPELPQTIKKVGVFVDATLEEVVSKIEEFKLQAVQLHGNESVNYCMQLQEKCETELGQTIELIKVFSIKDQFNFDRLQAYEDHCDYFLFDTKGDLPGGNGFAFNWSVLKDYPSSKPYFLSGGIGLDDIENIKEFLKSPASKQCFAIDVNSKFEIKPGLKHIEDLEKFKAMLTATTF